MTLWFTKHQEMIKGATGVDHKTKDIKGRNKIIPIYYYAPHTCQNFKNMHMAIFISNFAFE